VFPHPHALKRCNEAWGSALEVRDTGLICPGAHRHLGIAEGIQMQSLPLIAAVDHGSTLLLKR
jgi:hypothetical protein